MNVAGITLQWCNDGEHPNCCRIFDGENIYARSGYRTWVLMAGDEIKEKELRKALNTLLEK